MRKLSLKKTEKRIEELARYDLDKNKVFGCSYYVYQQDNFELKKCFGTTSAENGTPVTEKTLFRLASMTKPLTAFAALILIDRELLNLDDKVEDILPEFRDIHITDADGNDLGLPKKAPRLRNLLSHTSGIGSDMTKYGRMTEEDHATIDSAVDFLVKAGLDFEPESKELYSPMGAFDVTAKIISRITGREFDEFLRNEILIPCSMSDTTFSPTKEMSSRIIDMHTNEDGKNAVRAMPESCVFENIPVKRCLAGGGLISSLEDYGKFAKMLLNKGKTESGIQLVSEESFGLLCSEQYKICRDQSWGLGVRLITERTYPALPVGCFGWSGAYGTHFWVDPKNGIFAILMKNSHVDGGAGNESAVMLEKAVYKRL